MYKPSLLFERTAGELRDPFVSWARGDQAFFASGACHILAEMFRQLHYDEGFYLVHIKPAHGFTGNHVYATDGHWAFDHNGWTEESELLVITEEAYRKKYPGWTYERIVMNEDFEAYCKKNHHRLPWQFAYLPWERAYNYIQQFAPGPKG
jgi:hypothetical protein